MNVSPRIPVRPPPPVLRFVRLTEIDPLVLLDHMSDRRIARHRPLLGTGWDLERIAAFVRVKEQCWERDGLGHWAILADQAYAGWGGFQKEGDEWDFGLVLMPEAFGLGARITRKAIAFARADTRIPFVTFLLSPSRRNLAALDRLGASFVGEIEHDGATFLKYRLETR